MYSGIRNSILIATAVAVATPAAARTQIAAPAPAQPASEVRASGNATVSVTPDLAVVTIQFSASGKTPALAGRAGAARAAAIRRAIEALGVPRDSIPTKGRAGWWWANRSEMQFRKEMRDTIYVTNDQFSVRLHDFELIGRVIDTALAEGAQTISNVEFLATNTSAATIMAIKQAAEQARAYAAAIAEASGLTLGRAIDLSTDAQQMMFGREAMSLGMAMAKQADATEVVAPELKVTMTVQGRWEMVVPR
ncbi:MAG: SIMPL domain-containing protein [Gemmatimonadota bacterium]|nr:SIMPL domain-containing protein [Gemmatimonadota bacterium]